MNSDERSNIPTEPSKNSPQPQLGIGPQNSVREAGTDPRFTKPDPIYRRLLIATFALPFVAWIAGAIINPSGWMSHDLFAMVAFGLMIPLFQSLAFWMWVIPVLVLGTVIVFATTKKGKRGIPFLFMLSLVYSGIMCLYVSTAPEDEFAG